jgi:hypothetical protein
MGRTAKANIHSLGFVLLAVGLLGLLLNEFVLDWGRAATIAFAAVEVTGFAVLAFVRWGMSDR